MFPPQGRARQQTGRVLEVRGSENLIRSLRSLGTGQETIQESGRLASDALAPTGQRRATTPPGRAGAHPTRRGPGDLALTVRTSPPALIPDPRAADREPGTQRTFKVPYQMCSRGEPVLIPSSLSWY